MADTPDSHLKLVEEVRPPFGLKTTYYVDEFGQKQGPYREEQEFDWVETGTYQNNLKEGPFENLHLSDGSKIVSNYSHGKIDGLFRSFFKNGRLKCKYQYRNGEMYGPCKTWNEHGSLLSVGVREPGGYFTGMRITYYDNQVPKQVGFFKKDQYYGLYVWYDDRGVLEHMERGDDYKKLPLTQEEQDMLKLSNLFTFRNTPAYAIVDDKQRAAVQAFRAKYPNSSFLKVFDPKAIQEKTNVNPVIQEALAEKTAPKTVARRTKAPQRSGLGLNIAHTFFNWMPDLAYIRG